MEMPSGFKTNKPVCAIVSIAAATGADYQAVEQLFRARRGKGRRFTGVTTKKEYMPVIRKLGRRAIMRDYKRRISLLDWWATYGKVDTTYLVRVGGPRSYGHMMAFRNGYVLDQDGKRLLHEEKRHATRWCNFAIELLD